MADFGVLISIAQNVYQLSQSRVLKDIRDCKADLEKLYKTLYFIKNMLLDADAKLEFTHVEQAWVDELTQVLYEADDLFDEVITTAEMEELHGSAKVYEKVLDKVSRFFSLNNCILGSYYTSQEVKSIQQKLDVIAKDHARYEFKVDPQATMNRREDTCSFLDETHENIIGREGDVKAIIDMLLHPSVEENVGFVVIVGIGGLGKTTLARLVYKHDQVRSRFEKKLWACVSDQDGKQVDVKGILSNIIESSTSEKPSDFSTMQSMQTKLETELKNKMHLLILDDVWTEDPNEWRKLRRYLTLGAKGSKVVITTRSEKTAEVILGNSIRREKYMLKGLSDDDSWHLFKLTAFERESNQANDPEFTRIGKEIVRKCSNVPLAIKVLGTLLYGQAHKWESFEKNRLPQIETAMNPIMSILKLSYYNLEPSVKNCFRYCALFPKDFVMNKQELISLWMAQGYIVDDEDCFLILLKRCFFQDVEKDDLGDVLSFKMHDLIHDLAQEVAGDEFIVTNSLPINLCEKNRHLFVDCGEWKIDGEKWPNTSLQKSNIRTWYMVNTIDADMVKTLVSNWRCLRSLRLYMPDAENLSESIGELLHLRYLDLSFNVTLKTLPNSIVKLYNLQSLILHSCKKLKEWPKYFYKLVNLRLLDICGCYKLRCMPLGIRQMTNLCDLTDFKVGGGSSIGKQIGRQIKDLKWLVNLRGELKITIRENLACEKEIVCDDGYLEFIKSLKAVEIIFEQGKPKFVQEEDEVEAGVTNNEILIANLQPNRNLMRLSLNRYNGNEIPRWGRAQQDDWASILPNLVKIELSHCDRLDGIPMLSHLKHLKFLFLEQLNNLEYMEPYSIIRFSSDSKDPLFFPSLESLRMWGLNKLKGWWGGVGEGEGDISSLRPFPLLSRLRIYHCPELTSLPLCPSLESLEVTESNKSLRILPGERPAHLGLKLRVEMIDSLGYLTTLPAGCLTHISVINDNEFKMNSEIEKVFQSCSSLRSLKINFYPRPTSVSGILKHLTALESLSLRAVSALVDDDMPWRSLRHNLRSLKLKYVDSLQNLPRGMKQLTALRNLSIIGCDSLKGLPEWISCLSSLHSLTIESCYSLQSLGTVQDMTSLQKLVIKNCPDLKTPGTIRNLKSVDIQT